MPVPCESGGEKLMDIFDIHMHLPTGFRDIGEKKEALLAEMKRNGVSKGVVISDSATKSEIGSLRECAEIFAEDENIYVVGGISPFFEYKNQLDLLEKYTADKRVIGIKIYCGHEPIYLNDKRLEPVYIIAEKYGVPIFFHSGWDDPEYSAPDVIRKTAAVYRDIRFVCCHCCYPKLNECFEVLSEAENVYFDLSSTADNGAINKEIGSEVEKALGNMPDRILFGSDYASCDQREHIEFFGGLDISDEQKKLMFCENAKRLLNLQ